MLIVSILFLALTGAPDEAEHLVILEAAAPEGMECAGALGGGRHYSAQRDGDVVVALVPQSVPADALTVLWARRPVAPAVVEVRRDPDDEGGVGGVSMAVNGVVVTAYHTDDGARPYFHPVLGPGGVAMTRGWPMQQGDGERTDHPHHRSMWFAFGDVQGHDLWQESREDHGRIVCTSIRDLVSGPVFGEFTSTHAWTTSDGQPLGSDRRRVRLSVVGGAHIFDWEVTLRATHGAMTLGDTKEGMMALRVAAPLRQDAGGHIVTSEGARDGDAWGTRARWVDIHGVMDVDGAPAEVGVAMFDHPANLRHPTWWHVRTYGLFAANPFGLHHFTGSERGAGAFTIPPGATQTFRYRVVLHRGDPEEADLDGRYERWVGEEAARGRAGDG